MNNKRGAEMSTTVGLRTTWQDVIFGKVQYPEPCIYFVGPQVDGKLYCSYVGQSTNVGNRFIGHAAGKFSNIPDLLSKVQNPAVELFTASQIASIFRPILFEWKKQVTEESITGNWWEFLDSLWDIISDERDLLLLAEHISIFVLRPSYNKILSGRQVLEKYAYDSYAANFDLYWKFYHRMFRSKSD